MSEDAEHENMEDNGALRFLSKILFIVYDDFSHLHIRRIMSLLPFPFQRSSILLQRVFDRENRRR